MLGNKLYILVLFLISYASSSIAQENTLGFVFAPGISKSRIASGVGILYPDPPFYVNLRIREPFLFSYRLEVNKEKINTHHWFFSKALGFSSYSYIINYDYDREASVANNVSDRHDFQFLYGCYRVGKSWKIKNVQVGGYVGLTFNYLIRARTSYVSTIRTAEVNELNNYKRTAFGWEPGINISFPVNEKVKIAIRPYYSKIWRSYFHNERRIYSWGLMCAVLLQK
jgi:hypothetical protein